MSQFFRIKVLLLTVGMILVSGCNLVQTALRYPPDPRALNYRGSGAERLVLQGLSGPAVIHVVAGEGKTPFQISLISGHKPVDWLDGPGPFDEYRGYEFDPTSTVTLQIQGDRSWTVSISPADEKYYSSLKIPGKFTGFGNAVLFLDGAYGVATFDFDPSHDFAAWAYGPGRINESLYITPSGDYKGKSVLPIGATWIIVSAKGSWSVDIQAPCCVAPPGFEPKSP